MESTTVYTREKLRAVIVSMAVAFLLALFKLIAGIWGCSLAILASAVDSLMDVFMSLINFLSLREAEKPADTEHLYGHGKIESLAGLIESVLISVSGFYLLFESVRRLILKVEITHIPVAVVVMLVSIVLTFFVVRQLEHISNQAESVIVKAESLHYSMDLFANVGVIAALILVHVTGSILWDLVVALIIVAMILRQAFGVLKTSFDQLIDRSLPAEDHKKLEQMILGFDPRILSFHKLRTRKIGPTKFIDFHIEIGKESNFRRAHELTEALITRIKQDFPDSDVTIHYDPKGAE